MALNEELQLVVHCIRMSLSEKNALSYLEANLGRPIPPRTFYNWKAKLEGKKLKRLYEIAKIGFTDQHLERIDQLELIQKLMWENYHAEKKPYLKVKILESLVNVQPYLSSYYEATKEVMVNTHREENLDISNLGIQTTEPEHRANTA